MKTYRVDQVVDDKTYEGGRLYMSKWAAEQEAEMRKDADETTGEYNTSYKVVEVEV